MNMLYMVDRIRISKELDTKAGTMIDIYVVIV